MILHTGKGRVFSSNKSGALIWRGIEQRRPLDGLVDFHATNHPIIKSFEPGEEWGWCYVDELFFQSFPGSFTTQWCAVLGATT